MDRGAETNGNPILAACRYLLRPIVGMLLRSSKPAQEKLGDSVTFANGVATSESYAAVLEALVVRRGTPARVLNAGVQAYDVHQEAAFLSERGGDFEPDVVVVHHAVNDAAPRMRSGFRTDYSHYRRPWNPPGRSALVDALITHSDLAAALEVEEIRTLIRQIGLAPTKAKNLKRMAELLLERHGGEVPGSLEELEALPGVGHKTASVVMVQAFGVPAFPVDTHIHRLAQRWKLTSGKSVVQTERDLKRLFPAESWNGLHLRIIFFGREHCTARGCDGTVCEICRPRLPGRRPVRTRKA